MNLKVLLAASSLLVVGCQASPRFERCENFAASLESCHGAAEPELIQACEESDDLEFEESFECPQLGKADLGRSGFVGPCVSVVTQAAILTRWRNLGRSKPLRTSDLRTLRRQFGSLVDRVDFYFDSQLTNEWSVGFAEIDFFMDVRAQTFGHRVYVDREYRPGDEGQLTLLAHELGHVEQVELARGFLPFAHAYCVGFYESSFSYSRNPLEIEARSRASEFSRSL